MHSSEPLPPAVASGRDLLLQLGRLIIRSRSTSPARRQDRLNKNKTLTPPKPSTSKVQQVQPKLETMQPGSGIEAQLGDRVDALWTDHIPVCIEVLLAPECPECLTSLRRVEEEASFDKLHAQQRGLLLERWTMTALVNKSHESPSFSTSQWLLNAIRSQLHFSQLSAWRATLQNQDQTTTERRRKLSREKCNYKKVEANCEEKDPPNEQQRKLNIVYSIKIPGESYHTSDFTRTPTDHKFPITNIGDNVFLKVLLQSLPRIDDIPTIKCSCQKRRPSKETPTNIHEELVGKLNDLTLKTDLDERNDKVVDDRMLTPCSENGKHKCSCDDESEKEQKVNTPKKLDERRLKEIAKCKRRLRKESKYRKYCDSTSSEGDGKVKETTSIPILQAARFDRFRAIGCYRNQTYLTLPASRIETKSPFTETDFQPTDFKKTNTVATQTDDLACQCGVSLQMKCESCRGMVRSKANYNLAGVDNGTRRKREDDDKAYKKHKCDTYINISCDNNSFNDSIIKRPKLRRFFPIVDRIDKVVTDRQKKDIEELHLKTDDTVFSGPKDTKRQKTFSISDDYVMYEKCDYGTFDKCEIESPSEDGGFKFPDPKKYCYSNKVSNHDFDTETNYFSKYPYASKYRNYASKQCVAGKYQNLPSKESDYVGKYQNYANKEQNFTSNDQNEDRNKVEETNIGDQVPSPSEMDRFRWRFDSAASMVFHRKTGLPLTSSPAPLKRGNNCFDFDDSINGISGIKSALFHPISPASPGTPASPASPARAPLTPPPVKEPPKPKLRIGPSTCLLGSFEESALKGRLEPVATVQGFTAELGASGALCPPHRRLPVTVFFYAPGGTNAPYMGHINLGPSGYRVSRSGTVQVSLFNPHGTLVKMFVVLYDLTSMPPLARTFLRQRTLYMPAGAEPPAYEHLHKWLRYLIHLRFMTSKSGKLYLHTDIRILVSRKADVDTATAHSALFRPITTNENKDNTKNKTVTGKPETTTMPGNHTKQPEKLIKTTENLTKAPESSNITPEIVKKSPENVTKVSDKIVLESEKVDKIERGPNRVFGGCSEFDSELRSGRREIGYEQNGVSYELRSFTYAPENPKYSPR